MRLIFDPAGMYSVFLSERDIQEFNRTRYRSRLQGLQGIRLDFYYREGVVQESLDEIVYRNGEYRTWAGPDLDKLIEEARTAARKAIQKKLRAVGVLVPLDELPDEEWYAFVKYLDRKKGKKS